MILYLEDVTTTDAVDLGSCVLDNHPHDIYVNWCDDSDVEHYEGTAKPTITHLYSKAGKQKIKIYGELGWYGDSETSGLLRNYLVGFKIINISPISSITDRTFRNYSKLKDVDGKIFQNTKNEVFNSTFFGCKSLRKIPTNIFDNGAEVISFQYVFQGCTSLERIPSNLFSKHKTAKTFRAAFSGCSNISVLPLDLFKYNSQVTSFETTFNTCSKLEIVSYNVASNPNFGSNNPFNQPKLNEIALWNVIPSVKDLDTYISQFPTVTGGTLYLGVSEGFESTARTTLTSDQETALTAKGWTFGGVIE